MQTRTLYALFATGMLLATGGVFAQSSDSATSDATPAATGATFVMKAMPAELRLQAGATARAMLLLEARTDQTVHLSLRASDVLTTSFIVDDSTAMARAPTSDVAITAGTPTKVVLVISAPANATAGQYRVLVDATDDAGNHRDARIMVALHNAPTPATDTPARPVPVDRERPASGETRDAAPLEKRVDNLERRLNALMARIEQLFGRGAPNAERPTARPDARPDERPDARPEARPEPRPEPAARPSARMTLSDTNVTVGRDGGRVALLLAGGDHDARIQLAPRYDATSGWNVELEMENVHVAAHERAWIWVRLTPSEDAGPLDYAIVQVGSPGPIVAKGHATAGMA